MELKKGYKKTDIGILPEDWEVVELGAICYPSKDRINPITNDHNYKCIELEHLSQGSGILLGYADSKDLRSQKTIFLKGDVLFGKLRPYLRKYLLADFDGVCTTEIWVLKNQKNSNNGFLYYTIQSEKIIEVANISTGTKMPRAEWKTVSEAKIPLPPLPEQTRIAAALSDADAWISSLEKLISKKRMIKQGTMQVLLTPKEGWEIRKLGEIGEVLTGLTYSPTDVREFGILVLRSSNIQENCLVFEDNVYVEMDLPNRVIVKENDLLICVRNGSKQLIGKVALIDKKTEGSAFGAFMSLYRSLSASFVFYNFQHSTIQKQINEILGATINQITNKDLNSFYISLPTIEEQTRITTILFDMDLEIEALETKVEKARQVKQGMMQSLLTGKIRLQQD